MNFQEFLEIAETTNKRAHGELMTRFIVDTKKQEFEPVPSEMNHPEHVAEYLLKITTKEIEANPEIAEHFVSVAIEINNNQIQSVLTGISGLENWLKDFKKPFHTKEEVNVAHAFVLDFLARIGAVFAPDFKAKVVYL